MLRQAKVVVRPLVAAATLAVAAFPAAAEPLITRLTPPSNLFTSGERQPIVARFLPGQRFDLQATVKPDQGYTVRSVRFRPGLSAPSTIRSPTPWRRSFEDDVTRVIRVSCQAVSRTLRIAVPFSSEATASRGHRSTSELVVETAR